jgi:spore maturation protein CgeB
MRILHIGLCVQPAPINGFQKAFIDVVGKENYFEISTGEPDLNSKVLSLFESCKPTVVFMQIQAPNILSPRVMGVMKDAGAFVINWTGDKREDVPAWMVDCAPFVSVTSFSNMEDVHKMRSMGYKSEYLEIGYDPEIYKPEGEKLDVPEIVFMGNNYGDGHFPMSKFRREMVEFLRKEYGSRFGVYGSGWTNGNGNFNHSQHEEAKAYRGAKIAINVSHFDCEMYNSDRLLRILGSGVLAISFRHKGMPGNLAAGFFSNFQELKNEIDQYLSNEKRRNDTRLDGSLIALNGFTFNHQVENILKLAE